MKIMKRYLFLALAAAALFSSCAKAPVPGLNDANKRFFDAWVHVQKSEHPDYMWKQTGLGSWILSDEVGTGSPLNKYTDSLFVAVNYTVRNLNGKITATSLEQIDKQIGSYDRTKYYGPKIWHVGSLTAGVRELLNDMKEGGIRKAAIPGWLSSSDEYETAEEYLANSSGDDAIYEIEFVESIPGIKNWEVSKIRAHIADNYPDAEIMINDTTGFYYIQTRLPDNTKVLKDTTVYINYIGRLLDGRVFDTTVRDTAVRYGLYSAGRSYEPVEITYSGEEASYTSIKMGSNHSDVIKGFARTLSKMKAHEKGVGIFFSSLGYQGSGSGNSIPGYAPLKFEIELVDKP